MDYRILGKTGLSVSVLGFGASPLGNEFEQIDAAEGMRAVHYAVDQGINFFDVSPYYGRTLAEQRLGEALEGRRHKVVLATKCGRYDVASFDFSAARVTASVEESLRRLRTDYLDIIQAHDIEFGDREQIISETIPAFEQLQKQGKVRFIGITGLPLQLLADIAQRGHVDTVLTYCRYNLLIRDVDIVLRPLVEQSQLGLINASPLHMGLLTERGAPAWHPAPKTVVDAAARVVETCRRHDADVSKVALRFCLDYPGVATTLVGMSKTHHVAANLQAVASPNNAELLADIEKAIGPALNITWPSGRPENQDRASSGKGNQSASGQN